NVLLRLNSLLQGGPLFRGQTSLQAGHGGLQAYRLEEVTIVEREMNFKTVFFSNGSAHGVNHWALIQEGLLDDLLELDKVAYERFITILKSERVLSDGFY
uniref:hypothetical protein n=1 Tax=Alcaligenes xylosoxydans xylosoxydans TaxID=85698 RepID=UPI001F131EE5